jgi:serine/threonine-protein kinase
VLAADDATRLLTADTAAATGVLPAADGVGQEAGKKKRSPWTWPLIALIVLLLLVLGGTIWALIANQGGREPGPATSSSTPSSTPSATPTPTPTTVNVVASEFEGQDCATASAALDALELGANCVAGNAAPDSASEGKIYGVNPTGNVPKGTVVQLTYYSGQVAMPDPGAPTLPASVEEGSTQQVTWPGYSCPSGTGSVSSYNLTATNGVFPTTGQSTAAFGPNDRSGQVQVNSGTAGKTLIITYTVTCSGGSAGQRVTGPSGEAASSIQPASVPSPSPSTP